ncbi:EF-hand domain-containing protein [Thalassotalea profundi]|uniref:EF-hand domain-containing protein n=1 Tax=Thalassotalea profundi TaxID=2036687 RepID=A0ABQ3ILW8_9GAMM|nr:EF-hand domain-containing protein [Thalassotalea profundi]GHE88240.1 hypothetical protein GCM10011501_17060 [Thalassotalea profundi]
MKINTSKIVIFIALLLSVSSYAESKNETQEERPPRPTFESIDTNSDTDIDIDEFSAQKMPQGDPQVIFDLIDTDNNGVISKEEFTNHKPPRPQKPRGKRND